MNPYDEFVNFERRRQGYSTLEISEDRYNNREGLRRRIINRLRPQQQPLPEVLEEEGLLETSFGEGIAETTNLLTGQSVSSAAAVTLTTADKAVIGGVGTLTALGATKAIYDIATSEEGHTLPAHHYIGPGNPLDGKDPVDRDDQIAKEHDEAYDKAKDQSDVVKADDKAIHQFKEDFEKTGNIHSKVGEIGLLAKEAAEHIVGPIYPGIYYCCYRYGRL